jgi:hypothetical protein
MPRRAACRVLVGLLLAAAAACGSPAPPQPVDVPPNRFPKAGLPKKDKEDKTKPPAKP